MKCDNVRERLPLLIYGDLGADETRDVHAHLNGCDSCRHERDSLLATRQALDAPTVPEITVDVASIHAQSMAMQAQSMRRWKRLAIAASALAACLLAFLLIRPDVRVSDGQMVIRWGSEPERPGLNESAIARAPQTARDRDLEERIRVLSDLVQVLYFQMEHADQKRKEELEVLITRLDLLRIQSQQRWDETQRDVTTLYTSTKLSRREPSSNEP